VKRCAFNSAPMMAMLERRAMLRYIRSVVAPSYVTTEQVIALFDLLGVKSSEVSPAMVDIVMACWGRLVDPEHLYLLRDRLTPKPPTEEVNAKVPGLIQSLQGPAAKKVVDDQAEPPDEWGRTVSRLGIMALFDPLHPEGPYMLDVSKPDERQVALALVQLANKEHGPKGPQDSLTEFTFAPVKGKSIKKLPEAWPQELPMEGTWEVTYATKEEWGNKEGTFPWVDWKYRVKLAEDLKLWKELRQPPGGSSTDPVLASPTSPTSPTSPKSPSSPSSKSAKPTGPPPWQYHLDCYRAQVEYFNPPPPEESEVADDPGDTKSDSSDQDAIPPVSPQVSAQILLDDDITKIDHRLS